MDVFGGVVCFFYLYLVYFDVSDLSYCPQDKVDKSDNP